MMLRCVIKEKSKNLYIGECLELSLVAQGKTARECKRNLKQALEAFVEAVYEADGEKIAIRRVDYYPIRRIIFDLRYNFDSRKRDNGYFIDTRPVPIGI